MKTHYGTHVLFDFAGVDADILNNPKTLIEKMTEAVKRTGATILKVESHQFEPHGVSATFILQESHMAVHTWPETGVAVFDCYTCGDCDPLEAYEYLKAELQPDEFEVTFMQRGKQFV